MNAYDKARGAMGLRKDAELGAALANHHANKLKVIHEACKGYVVKLQCTGHGITNFFNGFFYSDSDYILTAGHILGCNGADKYTAVFNNGTSQEEMHDLELVQAGTFICDTVSNNVPVKVYEPDVAVFRCPFVPPHPARPHAAAVNSGDGVCVVGFKGVAEAQLSISDGIVSFSTIRAMHITAHVDDGYCGSPVLSSDGYLVGMVKAGLGPSIKHAEVVPATVINSFLISKGLPSFKG